MAEQAFLISWNFVTGIWHDILRTGDVEGEWSPVLTSLPRVPVRFGRSNHFDTLTKTTGGQGRDLTGRSCRPEVF